MAERILIGSRVDVSLAVELDDVSLARGGRAVLSGVSLTIDAGAFVGVLGANGSGKTTLLRALLGLLPFHAGRIRVLGQPPGIGSPAIGYMPQSRATQASLRLNGWDFVAGVVSGHRLGLPWLNRAGRAEVARVLDLVDAADLARRPLSETSGGERQRLLLAQALIGQPRLLLLDEPLSGLDPHHQRAVVSLVATLRQRFGIAVLFSAHEINPLLGAIDQVLYLGRGRAALGSVDEVITGPVLSLLYGSPIDVLRVDGRVFVIAGEQGTEPEPPPEAIHESADHRRDRRFA